MKFIPKIIPVKEKNKNFVVLEIGLGRVNIAIFTPSETGPKFVGVGRRSFTSADTVLDATLEATDALGAIVDELPSQAIVGVCGGEMEAVTTIAKYTRSGPKKPIEDSELASVLDKISQRERDDLKVFFSTVTSATIDNARVTNPLGVKGEKAEISCFVAYKPEEELAVYDKIIEELDLKPMKIMPSSFAISQMTASKMNPGALLVRIGVEKTEIAQLHNGHLIRVSNFDIGASELEFYNLALEAVLEKQDEKERSKGFWIYSDSDDVNLELVKKKLAEVDWKKKFNLDKDFKITLAEAEENFGRADVGLLALAKTEMEK